MSNELIKQAVLNKARKDKFLMVLDIPPILKKINTASTRSNALVNLNSIQFSVYGTVVPGSQVKEQAVPAYGQTYNVTSQTRPAYPNVTVDFTIDNNFDNYWLLWKWLAVMNDPKSSLMDEHFAKYTSQISTENFGGFRPDDKDNPISIKYKQVTMQNLFTDYQTTITLFPIREYNEMIAKFTYTNAFITKLGDINYSHRDTSEAECNFAFSFNQLHMDLLEPNTDRLAT